MRETALISPIGSPKEEDQSEAERLAIARRYRQQRGRELRELAQPHLSREVIEVGQFSTVPIEALAAIPILGAFFAFAARAGRARADLTQNVLLALDAQELHLLSLRSRLGGARAEPASAWPRADVRVSSVRPRFMRDEVAFEIRGEEQLKLYASSLRTNPWAAALVAALGGEAPEPLDLGAAEA